MYWCKLKAPLIIALICTLTAGATGCRPDDAGAGAIPKYFDIKAYFTAASLRLNKINRPVFKTVTHNGVTESKQIKIENWGQELDLFIASDINRPAWKNSYSVTITDTAISYRAKEEDLRVREILIKKSKQQVKQIIINTLTKNILYQTSEKLSFFPDSLYLIEKHQQVKLMGSNYYKIQGVIKP